MVEVARDFQSFVAKYDDRKYPPAAIDRLRGSFSCPQTINHANIEEALIWKYGHTGKANYPERQRALAARIADLWPANAIESTESEEAVLARWQGLVGTTSFITICFLLHLAVRTACRFSTNTISG